MTTPVQSDSEAYRPTTGQLEREAALRRFNRLYVYLPLGIFSLVGLVLIGLLLWGVFSPGITGTREFASGLADLVVILTTLPLLLLCALVPAAAIGLVIYRRQQPKPEHGRFQTLFWRLDTLVTKVQNTLSTSLPKAAAPIIKGHGWIAFLRAVLENLKRQFIRR